VFTHHFGGHGSSTKRHQDFVNELGFDCVSFSLDCEWKPSMRMSLREVWVAQLTHILDQVPGDKILYTFSSPSMVTPQVLIEGHRTDIRAWICDGGPFLDLFHCFQNYYKHQKDFTGVMNRVAASLGYVVIGAVGLSRRVRRWMAAFPPDVPVLSIRAGHDHLVSERAIDSFFAAGAQMNLQKVAIPEAEHLEGLKNFPNIYKPAVKEFLTTYAQTL
jgi:hypothetical protein